MTKEQIIHEISAASEPEQMSTIDAFIFYDDIIEILSGMKAALIESESTRKCPDCGEPQFECPSGTTCSNGHGY